ncbi:hypothetical protein FZC83_05335 [Rossellomorea marisflavi]|uniref:Uncharacterized protein n=1 Tax=Rossellomorea marisflavi TaxID=189381 RepID=A0A5D4S5G9_9BACI|nr:hypothetical protein [Rossellomorea marisflavi]TYS56986.1 hypothetical protein FZC83_05335 [Rossellomorea marisflavi]
MKRTVDKDKLSSAQTQLVFDFVQYLFEGDVANYWSKICRVDQARILGRYDALVEAGQSGVNFEEYVNTEVKAKQEGFYAAIRENFGISHFVRHTNHDDVMVFAYENIRGPVTYINEAMRNVYPILLTLDARSAKSEINLEWKVRFFEDYWFEEVNSDKWIDEQIEDMYELADD